MPKVIFYDGDAPRERIYVETQRPQRRRYGCMGFIFDLFMIGITGGLWLLWIFVREMRRR